MTHTLAPTVPLSATIRLRDVPANRQRDLPANRQRPVPVVRLRPVPVVRLRPVPVVRLRPVPVVRLRLTRRGRVVLTTLAAAPLVLGAVAFALNGGAAGASDSATRGGLSSYTNESGVVATLAYSPVDVGSARFVTVEPGQTLWDLAEKSNPAADPRDVVADIKRVNALTVETLQPGQRLELPAR